MAIISFLMWLGRGKAEKKLEKLVQADNRLLVEKLTVMCFHHGGFSRLLQAVRYQWLAEGTTEKKKENSKMFQPPALFEITSSEG